MAADSVNDELESERATWQIRLANLEVLLCELLAKNERLRQQSQMPTFVHSSQQVAQVDSLKS